MTIASILKGVFYTLLLTLSFSISAQGWIQRHPLKSISDVTEMHVSADQTIFALDATSTTNNVLVSTDHGEIYKNSSGGQGKDMHMLNDNLGFLVASDKLIKTTDKFESVEVFQLDHYFFSNVYFLSENVGYVSGESGRLHKTLDGGQTWTILPTNITSDIYDHYFFDENTGFLIGEDRTLLRTIDGGNIWSEIVLPIEDYWGLNKILFINSTQGILVGQGGHIFNTSDAGLTWTEAVSGTPQHINDVKYFNGKYVATCNNGIVLQSTDLGLNWSNYEINYWRDLYSVAFSNNTIYIGSEAEIFQSTDNGTTWTTHLEGVTMSELHTASFANDNTGLIVGKGQNGSGVYKDVMFRTTDAGAHWEEKSVSGGYYGVHFLPNGKALTSRYNINKVGYSSDYGETWSTINGPTITQQFVAKAIWLKSENDFFVGGGNYFASDGLYRYQTGIGWTHNPSLGNVYALEFLDDNFGVVSNNLNQFYKTTDGGDTWTLINYSGGSSYTSINLIDSNTFYIGSYITTDGGDTFELHQFPGYVLKYKFFDANFALGISNLGHVYRTLDAGDSWQLLNDNIIDDPNCCNDFYLSETTILALNSKSDIFTLDIGLTLSTEDFESTKNKFKIFPNPTSDKIFIEEINTSASDAIIYNLNGQKIKTYKLSEHQNGLDISDLAQGIYFMHLMSAAQLVSVHRIMKK